MNTAHARRTSLRLLPELAEHARQRAFQLGLSRSTFLGLLLWNFSHAPRKMKAVPKLLAIVRLHVPCSIRPLIWKCARIEIGSSGLSANGLMESLIAEDRAGPQHGLWVIAAVHP
jgi:hypothetical protein